MAVHALDLSLRSSSVGHLLRSEVLVVDFVCHLLEILHVSSERDITKNSSLFHLDIWATELADQIWSAIGNISQHYRS